MTKRIKATPRKAKPKGNKPTAGKAKARKATARGKHPKQPKPEFPDHSDADDESESDENTQSEQTSENEDSQAEEEQDSRPHSPPSDRFKRGPWNRPCEKSELVLMPPKRQPRELRHSYQLSLRKSATMNGLQPAMPSSLPLSLP